MSPNTQPDRRRPDSCDLALDQIAQNLPCSCPFPIKDKPHCMNCRARMYVARAIAMLDLPLLFHDTGPWGPLKIERWKELTDTEEATTKVMCDTIRRILTWDFIPAHEAGPQGRIGPVATAAEAANLDDAMRKAGL